MAALSGPQHTIPDAVKHVPDCPGLYAVYDSSDAWPDLGLETGRGGTPLYAGKAEDSLVTRDLKTHLADNRTASTPRATPASGRGCGRSSPSLCGRGLRALRSWTRSNDLWSQRSNRR